MLQAIISGKSANITIGDQKYSWRELFRTREDLITASVFGRLSYLSDNMIQAIMGGLLGLQEEPQSIGDFQEIIFWPRHAGDPNNQRSYVEPDVLIKFAEATILVEVKPPWAGQKYEQWCDEVKALITEEANQPDSLYFLALGGSTALWEDDAVKLKGEFKGINVATCTWRKLCNTLDRQCSAKTAESRDTRILRDQLEALKLHGIFQPPKPMSDLRNNSWKFAAASLKSWHAISQSSITRQDWNTLSKIPFQANGGIAKWT